MAERDSTNRTVSRGTGSGLPFSVVPFCWLVHPHGPPELDRTVSYETRRRDKCEM